MKNLYKYKTYEKLFIAWNKFCSKNVQSCENCKARHPTGEDCRVNWLYLECEEEAPTADALIEREKRVQEVALQLVARTTANVVYAFQLAEEYVAECEQREKVIKEGT